MTSPVDESGVVSRETSLASGPSGASRARSPGEASGELASSEAGEVGVDTPGSPPSAAREVFGAGLDTAVRYAELLADTGVSHGLIGPREVPRLWARHLLNCGVVAELLPQNTGLVDVGSGAGLPGVVIAIARPDVDVTLVEPMARRVAWLVDTVERLGLDNVSVRRGRAETFHGHLTAPVVTARAVAALDRLATWCAPLVEDDGHLLALKGRSAVEEVAAARQMLDAAGVTAVSIVEVGGEVLAQPTTVVDLTVRRPDVVAPAAPRRRSRSRRRRG